MSTQQILEGMVAASGNPFATLVVKATLAMAVALLLIRAARGASASIRHLVAAASFGVLLLLPVAALLVPERPIAVERVPTAVPATRAAAVPAPTTAPQAAAAAPAAPAPIVRISLADVALVIYLLGLAGFGFSLLAGIARLHRVRREAEVSVAGTRLANEAARREGMPGGIELAITGELAVPITFGWSQPVILLPTEAEEWSAAELARAIRHELEHIARGDWATHVLSRVALALYWPHPFAWSLWRRLRLEAERACDDAVIRSQGQAEPYAEQLVSLARRLRGRGAVPALSMATRSTLGQRVEAILDDRLRRAPRSRSAALFALAASLACVLAIAPVRVVFAATATVPDEPEVSADDRDDDDEDDTLDMALFEAAQRGDVKRMQRLIDQGAKPGAILEGDGTPLIGAARGGNLDAVRLLLDRGADIDLGVPGDGNALIMAAGAGRLDVVRYLIERGAAIEKVVPGDENALIHASESGEAEVVRFLLSKGADVNARVWAEAGPNRRGEWRTALLMARRNGHDEVVRILLAAGARE